jgi:hypothetical protein
MSRGRVLRTAGLILLTVATVVGLGALIVRDQITRHRRDLFSRQARRRLAALAYIASLPASVGIVQLLRDFIAWEPRTLLRRRALQVLARMERELEENAAHRAEIAG